MKTDGETFAELKVEGQTYQLPLIVGSEGERGVDIRQLRSQSGCVTLDSGFANTASCQSAITFLDGEKGILRYRGHPIEELAEKSDFIEVAYLLNFGKLPTSAERQQFDRQIAEHASAGLPEGISKVLGHIPTDAHPMGVLSSVTSLLSAFYPQFLSIPLDTESRNKAIPQLLAQTKMIAAHYYRRTANLAPLPSQPQLGHCADLLHTMFGEEGRIEVSPQVAKALDILFILHADHEQNCSTSTVRIVGSSEANVFATIAAGIYALWGQLHGGANQKVLEMLEQIHRSGGDYKKFIQRAKDKDDPFRLMGFGHRVYKNFDPRATIIKAQCDIVLDGLKVSDPLLDIARGLEEAARSDDYFISRHLYPNVDFYSGIIYKALGVPTNFFTVMFALGRLPGWLAQWREMREDPTGRIARPRQIYVGETQRPYPLG